MKTVFKRLISSLLLVVMLVAYIPAAIVSAGADDIDWEALKDKYGLTDEQIDEAWNALLLDIPDYKLDTLLELKQRYRLYLLSNTNALHWEEGRKRFDYKGYKAEDFFDQIFLSNEIHELKPSPEAFLKVARLAGIKPEETLFVDDLQVSCDAAAALGFHTYCPVANTDWRSELKI
jgi:putative hydrolase of the HAD superfamily